MIKDVPYFQLYAANFLANREFRLMSLNERGLLISIYVECWVNINVPVKSIELAKCLGFLESDVLNAFTNRVKSFLIEKEGNYISPELEGYREKFREGRRKQSEGGKVGAMKKKEKCLGKVEGVEGAPEGRLKGSLNQLNLNSFKSNQFVEKGDMTDEDKKWLDDYENSPDTSIAYLKASRG